MTAHRKTSRRAGQTLVEVLVAMVVLGVGLLSVMRAFAVCTNAEGITRSTTVAREFASRMMARVRRDPALLISEDEGTLAPGHLGFHWKRSLRATEEHGVVAVRVTVEWKNRGIPRRYSLATIVRSPGAQ